MDDLREFIEQARTLDELEEFHGAHWKHELGAITESVAERNPNPALLFDGVPGYESGFRVLTNPFGSVARTKLALNAGVDLDPLGVIDEWRSGITDYESVEPVVVDSDGAPIRENILTGDAADPAVVPAPKWHEHDGGRYIGTGCTVITRDPDTGWINLGVYRSVILDDRSVSVLVLPGKDGEVIMQKYHERGESCPVAMVLGLDPHTWIASTLTAKRQEGEYGIAGWIRGEPVEIIESEYTELPIPATAEIVLEGEIPPLHERSCSDGPFGEWPGYATAPSTNVPVLEVEVITHRDAPVLLGQPPLKPPAAYYEIPIRTAGGVWNQLENAGFSGISGIWSHVFERPMFLSVAVDQEYPGHAKQVATAAATVPNGAYGGRYVVVVDDDVDITNTADVLWALCTRCDVEDIDVVRDIYTSPLDPVLDEGERTSSRMVMDATRPYGREDEFPPVNRFDEEYAAEIREKWDLERFR